MLIIDTLKQVFHDMFTEGNGQYYCPVRILGTASLIHYLILSHIELIRHGSDFSLTDMATGISILLGVISAGISLKNKTDKQP